MANASACRNTGLHRAARSRQTRISGGSAETDVNAFAVNPCGLPSASAVVTIVTPVGNLARASSSSTRSIGCAPMSATRFTGCRRNTTQAWLSVRACPYRSSAPHDHARHPQACNPRVDGSLATPMLLQARIGTPTHAGSMNGQTTSTPRSAARVEVRSRAGVLWFACAVRSDGVGAWRIRRCFRRRPESSASQRQANRSGEISTLDGAPVGSLTA